VKGGSVALRFIFDSSVRLSRLENSELLPELAHELRVADATQQSFIELSQLSETKTTIYALFKKRRCVRTTQVTTR
jgi:hypothetical protein